MEPSTSDTNIISSNQVSEAPSEVSQIGEVSNSEKSLDSEKNLPSQSEQKPESENQVPETEVADSETKGPASEEQLIAERMVSMSRLVWGHWGHRSQIIVSVLDTGDGHILTRTYSIHIIWYGTVCAKMTSGKRKLHQ